MRLEIFKLLIFSILLVGIGFSVTIFTVREAELASSTLTIQTSVSCPTGDLNIKVTSRLPVMDAYVTLFDSTGNILAVKKTGSNGEVIFTGLSIGTYHIKTAKNDYSTTETINYGSGSLFCRRLLAAGTITRTPLPIPSPPPSSSTCTDSDNGKDYNVKGTTKKGTVTNVDSCFTTSTKTLWEYYCKSDGTIGLETYTCANTCSDGRCITSSTPAPTPTPVRKSIPTNTPTKVVRTPPTPASVPATTELPKITPKVTPQTPAPTPSPTPVSTPTSSDTEATKAVRRAPTTDDSIKRTPITETPKKIPEIPRPIEIKPLTVDTNIQCPKGDLEVKVTSSGNSVSGVEVTISKKIAGSPISILKSTKTTSDGKVIFTKSEADLAEGNSYLIKAKGS